MSFTDILTVTAIGLGATTALVIAFSWVFARLWCKPKRQPPFRTPADYELPFEPIMFSSHGAQINGWFIPAACDTPSGPVIILTHGWSRNAAEMLLPARHLHEAGFAILLCDGRGHGTSGEDGPITVLKFAEDIIANIEYLETRSDVDRKQLGVLGRSIGGAGAILAASTDARIRAVVSCSAFANPEALTRGSLARLHIPTWPFTWLICRFIERWLGTNMDNVAPQNRVGQIAVPVLLIHGGSDRFISPSSMEILYAQAPHGHTERLLIPGRRHSDVIRDSRFGQAIVEFFSKNL